MQERSLQDSFERGLTGGKLPPPKPIPPTKLPTPLGRAVWFCMGLAFVAVCAVPLSLISQRGYLASVTVLLATQTAVVVTIIGLMVRWARSNDDRMRQFSVGSMLLVLLIFGVVLGMLRWFAEGNWHAAGFDEQQFPPSTRWILLSVGLVFMGPLGLLFALRIADALLWLGVWLLRRRQLLRKQSQSRKTIATSDGISTKE